VGVINNAHAHNSVNFFSDAATKTISKQGQISTLGDSGATDFMLRRSDAEAAGVDIGAAKHGGLVVELPNKSSITSVGKATIHIDAGENNMALTANVFEDDQLSQSLTPISAFTNSPNNCDVTFTANGVQVEKDGVVLLSSPKDVESKLWNLNLPLRPGMIKAPTRSSASLAVRCELDADFVNFWHATFGSPTAWTFTEAVRRGYFCIPRLTQTIIQANTPNTAAMHKGHLDRTRQGQQSTKATAPAAVVPLRNEESELFGQSSADAQDGTSDIFTKLITCEGVNSSDLTSRFPVTSRGGYSYFLVSIFNGYIHSELMRSRSKAEYVRAFKATLEFFKECGGAQPRVQRLDNEKSDDLKQFFKSEARVEVEYVAPGNHRANLAERAIRDFKNHLIAVLSTTDPSFPVELFDELMPQMELTLNHLRPCRHKPSVSAYEGLHGKRYDFGAHPIAPAGVKVVVFESPGVRGAFAPHGLNGFYLGPAVDHYRCWRCWVVNTRAIRITDTLGWLPAPYKMPGASPIEQMHASISDLCEIMKVIAQGNHIQIVQRGPMSAQVETAAAALREMAAFFAPPGLDPANSGATYPARRARQPHMDEPPAPQRGAEVVVFGDGEDPAIVPGPGGGLQRVQAAPSPVAHPVQIVAEQEAESDQDQRPPEVTSNAGAPEQRVHDAVVQPVQPIREEQLRPEHATQPNQPIMVAANRLPSRPGAVTRQLARSQQSAAFSAIGPPVSAPSAPATFNQVERRGWALNLDPAGMPLKWRAARDGPNKPRWIKALIEEFVRLVTTTKTMKPILMQNIPHDRRQDITYISPQCKEKLVDGEITSRVRLAAGGDKINYEGPTTAQVADMSAVKILINSVVSDKAQWATADIKDFYLGTPLPRPEYVRVQLQLLPEELIELLQLREFIERGSVLFEVNKAMYGLPNAGLISQDRLIGHLDGHGYKQSALVPCLFRHESRSTAFSLVVDDFGIKYTKPEDLEHFITIMKELYEMKVDRTGSQYLGFAIKFSEDRNKVHLSLPGYVAKAIERFCPHITRGSRSPAVYVPPKMGAQGQLVDNDHEVDTSPKLPPAGIKRLQEIVGVMLYYARAVDGTMLPAVNYIGSRQAQPTQRVMNDAMRLMAYAAAFPNNELVFTACDMILYGQADCSFLSRPEARSVAGGIEYLGNKGQPTQINGAIHAFSSIIPVVVASVAEGEYGAGYMLATHAIGSRHVLEFFGYPQPPTLIMGDNECAVGLANNTLKIKRSKSINMQFHWLRDRIRQGQFEYQWRRGANNLADFYTKALPVHVHLEIMPFLVHTPRDPQNMFLPKDTRRGQRRASAI
jgi:hypothetical protein